MLTKNGTVAEVPAGSNLDFVIPITETGYTPIGVVGVIVAGSGKLAVINTFIGSGQTTATVRLVNSTTSDITPTSIQANILYIKND